MSVATISFPSLREGLGYHMHPKSWHCRNFVTIWSPNPSLTAICIIFPTSMTGLSGPESPVQAGSNHPLITVTINPLEQDEVFNDVEDGDGHGVNGDIIRVIIILLRSPSFPIPPQRRTQEHETFSKSATSVWLASGETISQSQFSSKKSLSPPKKNFWENFQKSTKKIKNLYLYSYLYY